MRRLLPGMAILFLFTSILSAQTAGQLSVSVSTSMAGGNYAPRNIVAIWIEDDQGNFVKTLLALAANRKTHLNTWQATTTAAGSAYNVVDAITGPTQNSHSTRSCTWDGKDIQGQDVSDGTYHVWMELTDKNSTGNYSSFSFTKGSSPLTLNPQNEPSFSSISIEWMPTGVGINEASIVECIYVSPNPVTDQLNVKGDFERLEVIDLKGRVVVQTTLSSISLIQLPKGLYLLKLYQGNTVDTRRIVKD